MKKAETQSTDDADVMSADAPAEAAVAPETLLPDPEHEWPTTGGCYVRQADGTLKRED